MTTERSEIPQTILDYVGLDQVTLSQFESERQESERQKRQELLAALETGEKEGRVLYTRLKNELEFPSSRAYISLPLQLPGNIAEIELDRWSTQTISKVPGEISRKWLAAKSETSIFETDTHYIDDLIVGFGEEAFEQKDWPSAASAFDVTTEGGILNSTRFQELIASLPLTRDNHQDRLDIAKAIQEKLDEKERQRQREELLLKKREERDARKQSRLARKEKPSPTA